MDATRDKVGDECEGGGWSYESTPSLPCFEGINVEDRPLPPPADDYPLGCEVELRDVDFAKVAQESRHWEPFMEEIFSVPRRVVRVCRHLGDYTFVQCANVGGMEIVGCTLYRACLSEPKVKTTKYFANMALATEAEEDDMHELYSAAQGDIFDAATPSALDDFGAVAATATTSPPTPGAPRRAAEAIDDDDDSSAAGHKPASMKAACARREGGSPCLARDGPDARQASPDAMGALRQTAVARRSNSNHDVTPSSNKARRSLAHSTPPPSPPPATPSGPHAETARSGGAETPDRLTSPALTHSPQPLSPPPAPSLAASAEARRQGGSAGETMLRPTGEGGQLPPRRRDHDAPARQAARPADYTALDVDVSKEDELAGAGAAQQNSNTLRAHNRFATVMRKGTQELNRHNYEKALWYYNVALRECPAEEARVLSSRSVAYLLLRQTDNALADAKRVIELQPNSYIGYVRAGNILRGMKLMSDAQVFYKEARKRDPKNVVIQRLLLSNSVAMLYDPRVRHCSKFKVAYDDASNQVIAVARQSVRAEEVVLKERTSLAAALDAAGPCCAASPLSDELDPRRLFTRHQRAGSSGSSVITSVTSSAASQRPVLVCQQCFAPLVRVADICQRSPALGPQAMRSLHGDANLVPCSYECGSVYCSNECRSHAWADHHWVQCPVRGRWSVGIRGVEAYLVSYVANAAHGTTRGAEKADVSCSNSVNVGSATVPAARAAAEGKEDTSSGGGSGASDAETDIVVVAQDTSATVAAACVRVAVRMLARMLGSVWMLRDAVHMYDWVRVSPVVEAQRATTTALLRPCYDILSQSFLGKEKPKLNYELFERCYERVKSNAVLLRVSVWGKILFRAESHLALMGTDVTGKVGGVAAAAAAASPCPSLSVAAVLPRLALPGEAEENAVNVVPKAGSRLSNSVSPSPPCCTASCTSRTSNPGRSSGEDGGALASCLRLIMGAPPAGLPGTYTTCLCFFELFAATIDRARAAPRAPATVAAARHESRPFSRSIVADAASSMNVQIKSMVEPSACIHLRTTRGVVKGERFVTDTRVRVAEGLRCTMPSMQTEKSDRSSV